MIRRSTKCRIGGCSCASASAAPANVTPDESNEPRRLPLEAWYHGWYSSDHVAAGWFRERQRCRETTTSQEEAWLFRLRAQLSFTLGPAAGNRTIPLGVTMSPGFVGLEWKLSYRDGRGGRTHAEEGILDVESSKGKGIKNLTDY